MKIAILIVLFITMVGLAYHIEITARPTKNVKGQVQQGHGHEH